MVQLLSKLLSFGFQTENIIQNLNEIIQILNVRFARQSLELVQRSNVQNQNRFRFRGSTVQCFEVQRFPLQKSGAAFQCRMHNNIVSGNNKNTT